MHFREKLENQAFSQKLLLDIKVSFLNTISKRFLEHLAHNSYFIKKKKLFLLLRIK
jgi:hypothetical protein